MDERVIEDFGVARAPARGRFRIFALLTAENEDSPPVTTVGLVDVDRDRSLQINLAPTRRRVLGLWRRPALLKVAWAYEGGDGWPLFDHGRARIDLGASDGRPNMNDVLLPLRAAAPDLATALVLLRSDSEHSVALPPDGREVRLTTTVEGRVLRVDVYDDRFHSPVFLAPADATDHDLVPPTWPPLISGPAPDFGPAYARFMPPLWRAAADLLREAGSRRGPPDEPGTRLLTPT